MNWLKQYFHNKQINAIDNVEDIEDVEDNQDDVICSITFALNSNKDLNIYASWSEEKEEISIAFGKMLAEINSGELSVATAQTLLESNPKSEFINQILFAWMKFSEIKDDMPVISAMETFGGGK